MGITANHFPAFRYNLFILKKIKRIFTAIWAKLFFIALKNKSKITIILKFYKYQGTGNDFIMIDNRKEFFPKSDTHFIEKLCNRRFGIGADGLILLENDTETSFRMVYYNSDGNQSSMCGNGGRCIVAFAKFLNIIDNKTTFIATDGLHNASILENGIISLQMKDVKEIKLKSDYTFLNTGSPHHVAMVEDLEHYDVKSNGAKIRYSNLYGNEGSNINFVKQLTLRDSKQSNHFALRTYERGVEDETLSCGTGATATAIAMHAIGKTNSKEIHLDVQGGKLKITFDKTNKGYENVFLIGPATFVFEGEIDI